VNWNRFSAAAIAERSLKNAIQSLTEIREKLVDKVITHDV